MKPVFYTAKATIGVASHIALEESGLDYELVVLDFSKKEQTGDDYRKVNPKARVPSLIIGDTVLTETPAILVYIAQMAPTSALALPEDPLAFAQIQSFNSYLCSTVHVAHAHRMRGTRWTNDEHAIKAMAANVPNTMAQCFELIESTYLQGPWVWGNTFTISDPYLYAISSWLESDGVDVNNYPKMLQHRKAMQQRESVKAIT